MNPHRRHWALAESLAFLNHGSYGAVPNVVSQYRAALLARMEHDPVRFFKVDLEELMDAWRERLGGFINCPASCLAPAPNATVALCTIFHHAAFWSAAPWREGDEVLLTDHEYMSGVNELRRLADRTGVRLVFANIPFPIREAWQATEAVLGLVTPRTRLVVVSQITSASSLVLPVEAITARLNALGVDSLIDGTHAPGQVPVDLGLLRPTYYVGSGHKWLSSPKGAGFLYVRPDRQEGFRPVWLSSRSHKPRADRPFFLKDFDYVGTEDYTKILAMTAALDFFDSLLPGGWPEVMRRNHELLLRGRDLVCRELGLEPAAPDAMTGAMTSLLLPEPSPEVLARPTRYDDPLQDALVERHGVVAPIWRLSADNRRIVRLSAQLYNTIDDFRRLAGALRVELAAEHPARAVAAA